MTEQLAYQKRCMGRLGNTTSSSQHRTAVQRAAAAQSYTHLRLWLCRHTQGGTQCYADAQPPTSIGSAHKPGALHALARCFPPPLACGYLPVGELHCCQLVAKLQQTRGKACVPWQRYEATTDGDQVCGSIRSIADVSCAEQELPAIFSHQAGSDVRFDWHLRAAGVLAVAAGQLQVGLAGADLRQQASAHQPTVDLGKLNNHASCKAAPRLQQVKVVRLMEVHM